MNSSIAFIIGLIVGALITEIINILFTPFKDWFNFTETKEYCNLPEPHNFGEPLWNRKSVRQEIIITERFGKTTNINCPHFKSEDTKIEKYKGKKYLYCRFGEHLDAEDEDVKGCPFC